MRCSKRHRRFCETVIEFARLELARTYARNLDVAASRGEYEQLFAMRKDPDFRMLVEADLK